MAPLPFNLDLVQFFIDHRTGFLTSLFLLAATFGSASVYILFAILIYVAWDKQLAIRLSVLILFTMAFNDLLKLAIKNPRPFIREGTWQNKWAVSPQSVATLAAEYSTPSGHAMGSSAFYSCLYGLVHKRIVRAFAVVTIFLIGLSRPYLGVHHVEDVLIGWAIGITIALVSIRYAEAISSTWNRLSYPRQIATAAAASLALWLLAALLNGRHIQGQPRDVLSYAGFITGIAIARPLELRIVNFDPQSSSPLIKTLRGLLSVGMVLASLLLLGRVCGIVADHSSFLGSLADYLRFIAAGFITVFLAPLVFTKIGWAERAALEQNQTYTTLFPHWT